MEEKTKFYPTKIKVLSESSGKGTVIEFAALPLDIETGNGRIFLNNKYTKWYFNIIEKVKDRNSFFDYIEIHHIIPRSLGGNDSEENLVNLTAKEHFICHLLLTKMTTGLHKSKMIYALNLMMFCSTEEQDRYLPCSRIYEYIRQEVIKLKNKAVITQYGDKFDSIKEAVKWCGLIGNGGISGCCAGYYTQSGKHPVTGKQLCWKFLEDFTEEWALSKQDYKIVSKYVNKAVKNQFNDIFESQIAAAKWCNMKSSGHVSACCKGLINSAGKHPISGERLVWNFVGEIDE
jgi:ribosomal protein S17E